MGTPIAFNSGTTASYDVGVFKKGTVALNLANTLASGYNWWNGVDVTSSQYLIYSDTFSQGQATFANSRPTAWTTPDLNDSSLLALINTLPDRVGLPLFTDVTSAVNWMNQTGKYYLVKTGYDDIVTSGLIVNFDFGWYNSYPGTGTSFSDISGNFSTGTLFNGVGFSSEGQGTLKLDGTNDYGSGSLVSTLSAPFTLEIWGKFDSVTRGDYEYLGALGGLGTNTMVSISKIGTIDGNTSYHGFLYIYPGFGDAVKTNISLKDTEFQQITIVLLSSAPYAKVYKNGVEGSLVDSLTGPINLSNSNFFIGTWANSTWWLDGNIGIFRVYNRALSSTEVLQNFNAQRYRFGINNNIITRNLLLYLDASNPQSYPGSGSVWYDLSGNGAHGTLINSPAWNSNGYFTFDGTDDGVDGFNVPQNYTDLQIEMYSEGSNGQGLEMVFAKYDDFDKSFRTANGIFRHEGNGGDANDWNYLNTQYDYVDGQYITTNFDLTNQWHFVRLVRSNTTFDPPFVYSISSDFLSRRYKGRIKKIMVYGVRIDPEDVDANYYGGNIVTDNLLAYFDASNPISYPGTGSTWKNLLNGGSNGTLNGSAVYNSIAGGSIEFNGPTTYDYVSISDTVTHKTGQDFSYECWVYFTNLTGFDKTIVGKVGCNIGLLQAGSAMGMVVFGPNGPCAGGNSQYTAFGTTNTNVWEHWVGTYEVGVGIKTYKNGVLVNSAVVTGNIGNYPDTLFIGGSISANYTMDGYVQSAKTYSKCLTPLEVSQNFQAQKSRFGL